MGSACSKRDEGTAVSREALTQKQERARKTKDKATGQPDMMIPWFERFSIDIECWGTSSKRILPKNNSMVTGCKYVIITRITLEKKQLTRTTIGNKKGSNLNSALRHPELDLGAAQVRLQFPKLLPLNLWTGETYLFAFMQDSNLATSNVTLVGKVGNEEVRINQTVLHNPSLSTDRWKRIGDILKAEMNKHKMSLTKESSKSDVRKKDSRDTGYTSTSYKYSSDASQRQHSHRHFDSTDSDDYDDAGFDNRRPRKHDSSPHSPHRFVQMSYKKRVEESKLVEERESSSKSTDDSKSSSSCGRQLPARKHSHSSHSSRIKKISKQSRKESLTIQVRTQEMKISTGSSAETTNGSDSQHSNSKTAKKRKSVTTTKSFIVSDSDGQIALLGEGETADEVRQSYEDEKCDNDDDDANHDDADADDESDKIDAIASEKVENLSSRRGSVRPKLLKIASVETNANKNYSQTDGSGSSVDKDFAAAASNKRHSLSEIMEKQDITSPQQRYKVTPVQETTEMENSPKAKYFALHQYGSKEKKKDNSDTVSAGTGSAMDVSKCVKHDEALATQEALGEPRPRESENKTATGDNESAEGRSRRQRKVTPVPLQTPPTVKGKIPFKFQSSIDELPIASVDLSKSNLSEKSEEKERQNDGELDMHREVKGTDEHLVRNEESENIILNKCHSPGNSSTSIKVNVTVRDKRETSTAQITKRSQIENKNDATDKSMGATEQGNQTRCQKDIRTDLSKIEAAENDPSQEARIRAQSFGGVKRESSGFKIKRYHSEQTTGGDGLRSKHVSMRDMPSPVLESSPVHHVKEAFVDERNVTAEPEQDSDKKKDHTNFGKQSARKLPYAGSGKKISKFYSKTNWDARK